MLLHTLYIHASTCSIVFYSVQANSARVWGRPKRTQTQISTQALLRANKTGSTAQHTHGQHSVLCVFECLCVFGSCSCACNYAAPGNCSGPGSHSTAGSRHTIKSDTLFAHIAGRRLCLAASRSVARRVRIFRPMKICGVLCTI